MSDCLSFNPVPRPTNPFVSEGCCYGSPKQYGGCAEPLPVGTRCESQEATPYTYQCVDNLEELVKLHPLLPSARTSPIFSSVFDCIDDEKLARFLHSLKCFSGCGCPPDILLYAAAHFLSLPLFDSATRLNLLEGGAINAFPKDHWSLTTWGTVWKQLTTARIAPVFGGF